MADHLIGHFVDQARRAGASWTSIGASMGVTKQAAQQRFVARPGEAIDDLATGGFSRFTPRARELVVQAQRLAETAGHAAVGTEHILLALLEEPDGAGGRVLRDARVEHSAAEEWITAQLAELIRRRTQQ